MENIKFIHKVSKGSRFNQIYIPKEMEIHFESGDLVEVTLLEKKSTLYYSKNLKKLGEFKEDLIKKVFSILSKSKDIKQIFFVGSFLTKKIDYNDIDIIIISNKSLEKEVYNILTDKFNLKFHILEISEEKFEYLQKSCPLTRSMLYFYISNKSFNLSTNMLVDKNHIKFLLMMPQDIISLDIPLDSRVYYDSLRRLISIERFLDSKDQNPISIEEDLINILGNSIYSVLKSSSKLNENLLKKTKEIIKNKLYKIEKIIK